MNHQWDPRRSMRRPLLAGIVMLSMLGLSVTAAPPGSSGTSGKDIEIDVLFSPRGGCAKRITEAIAEARKTIRVQAYMFTLRDVADALVAAHKRGVRVQVVLDKSQEKMRYGRWPVLHREGIEVLFDREHDVANNKVILIDRDTIITGSYNFTKAAEEKNAENLLVIRNAGETFERFLKNFEEHAGHSHKSQS